MPAPGLPKDPARAHVVSAFDARTRLGELLARCEQGESIVITRHGHPVARLVPFSATEDAALVRTAVHRLAAFGADSRLPRGITLRQAIDRDRVRALPRLKGARE